MSFFVSAILRVFITGLAICVWPLSGKLERATGKTLGYFLYFCVRWKRKIAMENIRNCYPEWTEDQRRHLLRENYLHYGMLVLELLHYFVPGQTHYRKFAQRNAVLHGLDKINEAKKAGKGVLFVSSHLANWELMSATGGILGINLTMVTKRLKPEWLHRKIEEGRASVGLKAVYEPRTLPGIMRALRNNECVGFVFDQYAGPPIGIPVLFFGVEVGTLAAVGTLVERTGAIILPARTVREADGKIHVYIEDPMDCTGLDAKEVTQKMASSVEKWVRSCPSQWLWIHRRFKKVVWARRIA